MSDEKSTIESLEASVLAMQIEANRLQIKINEAKAAIDELGSKLSDNDGMPKHGEVYYFVNNHACVYAHANGWKGSSVDIGRWRIGNVYPNEEEAEAAKRKQEIRTRVLRMIKQLNNGWVPDWSDRTQNKWYLMKANGDPCWGENLNPIRTLEIKKHNDSLYMKSYDACKTLIESFSDCELVEALL